MKLTDEQKYVIKEILKFKNNIVKLGGLAGTGKSTVIQHLAQALPNFAVCAYTGKAVNVLRKKGLEATTIHSLIYKAFEDDGKVRFALANDISCEGVIVDEASMVSRDIFQDLYSFRKPLIFVGDHGQLEPIGDRSFNLMEFPDYKLEAIHRNAGEIAHFAEYVRNGYKPSSWKYKSSGKDVKFIGRNDYKQILPEVDQIICAYNKTRAQINVQTREILGRQINVPQISDKIICLRNNSSKFLFNGMQGHIGWFHTKNFIQFVSDSGSFDVDIDLKTFNQIKYEFEFDRDTPNPFDYAYAITCHKCVSEDTLLITEKGCVPIKELWNNKEKRLQKLNLNLATSSGTHKAIQIFKGDFEDAIRIKTNSGFELIGSYRHPILTWDSDNLEYKWKLLPEINKEDLVCISRKTDLFSKKYIETGYNCVYNHRHKKVNLPKLLNEDLALVLGYLVGDGHYNTKSTKTSMISLTTQDEEIKINFKKIIKNQFGLDVKTKLIKNNKANSYYFISQIVRDYFEDFGLDHVVKDKKIVPFSILQSPKSVQKMFIRGIFDTDGSASSGRVRLVNISSVLLRQVQIILLNFGIVSQIKANYNKKYKKNYFVLSIFSENLKIFCNQIGFGIKYKQNKIAKICKKIKGKTNNNYIPGGNKLIISFKKDLCKTLKVNKRLPGGLSKRALTILSSAVRNSTNLSYYNLEKLINECKSLWTSKIEGLDSFRKLNEIFNNYYYFDKITEITKTQAQMYDLSVPYNKSFIGNGFVNHNSQGDQFGKVLVLEQKCDLWEHPRWAYTAASRAMTDLYWCVF